MPRIEQVFVSGEGLGRKQQFDQVYSTLAGKPEIAMQADQDSTSAVCRTSHLL